MHEHNLGNHQEYKKKALSTLIYYSFMLDIIAGISLFIVMILFPNGSPIKLFLLHDLLTIMTTLYCLRSIETKNKLTSHIYIGSEIIFMFTILMLMPEEVTPAAILGMGSFVILSPFVMPIRDAYKWGIFASIVTIIALSIRSDAAYHFTMNLGGFENIFNYSFVVSLLILYVILGSLPGQATLKALQDSENSRREVIELNTQLEATVAERTKNLLAALEDAKLAQGQAEIANLHKSQFLANMSHELRTPLNAIIGFSELMLMSKKNPINEPLRNKMEVIFAEGQHLLHLINNLLDLSKIEAGRMELEPEWVDINDVLERVRASFTTKITDKGLDFSIISSVSRHVWVDDKKIYQILLNLVSNAIKFTEEGSVVVRASQDAELLTVSVEDTGIGIAESQRESIFEEFRQISGQHQRDHQGTGLGLAITKHLVNLHGGRIWISGNDPKPGCTFSFTLPLTDHSHQNELQEKENLA